MTTTQNWRRVLLLVVVACSACHLAVRGTDAPQGPLAPLLRDYAAENPRLRCQSMDVDANRSLTVCVGFLADTVVSFQLVDGKFVLSRYREWSVPEDSVPAVLRALRSQISTQVGPEGRCDAGSSTFYYRGRDVYASIRVSPGHRPTMRTAVGVSEFVYDENWLDSMRIAQVQACSFDRV